MTIVFHSTLHSGLLDYSLGLETCETNDTTERFIPYLITGIFQFDTLVVSLYVLEGFVRCTGRPVSSGRDI